MPSRLTLEVLTKVESKELDGLAGKLNRIGHNLTKFVTVPLVGAGIAAFKFASDAEESTSKARTVFGKAFKGIEKDAGNLEDAFSEATFLDTAGTFGAIAQGMGATQEQSAELSKQWLGMAQDFASFNNVPIEESLTAIRSALSGEFEPLKRFGVLLSAAKVEAKALEMGLVKAGEPLDDNAKLLATNALILEKMGPAVGDFARTADGAANSTRNLAANSADLAAGLGQSLLPIGQKLIGMVQGVVTAFTSLPAPVQEGIVIVLALAAAIGPLLGIVSKLIPVFRGVIVVFNLLKVALLTNPFTALAVAVAAIAALIILNWDKIWGFLKKTWEAIKGALGGLAEFFSGVWEGMIAAATGAWDSILGIITGAINGVIDVINGLFGFLNGIQIGIPEINVGPVHVGGGVIDPFNIGLIPHLASGGIIDSPTLALIGERGPEAVVPLNKGSVFGDRVLNLTIQAPLRADDAADIAEYIDRVERLERAMDWDASHA